MAPIRTRSRQSSVSLSPISPLTTINQLNSPPPGPHSDLEPPPYSPPGRSHSTPSLTALGLDLSPWATAAHPTIPAASPCPALPSRHSSASLASQHLDWSPPGLRQLSLTDHPLGYAGRSGWPDDDTDQLQFGHRQSSARTTRRRTTTSNQPNPNMARARNVASLPESEAPLAVSSSSCPDHGVGGGGFTPLLMPPHSTVAAYVANSQGNEFNPSAIKMARVRLLLAPGPVGHAGLDRLLLLGPPVLRLVASAPGSVINVATRRIRRGRHRKQEHSTRLVPVGAVGARVRLLQPLACAGPAAEVVGVLLNPALHHSRREPPGHLLADVPVYASCPEL